MNVTTMLHRVRSVLIIRDGDGNGTVWTRIYAFGADGDKYEFFLFPEGETHVPVEIVEPEKADA